MIWYNTGCYKWTNLIIFMLAAITLVSLQIVDTTIKTCNDAYHTIEPCLNSTTCELRYCEPSICNNHTCLPRVFHPCRHKDSIYYPDDRCPDEIFYQLSWINLVCAIILLVIVVVYIITLIHYRCYYYYRVDQDDSEWTDLLNETPNGQIIICDRCRGTGADALLNHQCGLCKGAGRIIKRKATVID